MKLSLHFIIEFLNFSQYLVVLEGKIVQYTFTVGYISGYPDGVRKDKIPAINGQFPGPTIEAKVGDTLIVDVINKIQDGQNTSLHWHGLKQNGSQFEDGPSMITQCPLKNGFTQRYKFPLRQSGTFWYHSHYRSQYTDGLWGAIIIHRSNEPYIYDGEIVIRLSDWYHQDGKTNEDWYLSSSSGGTPPFPNSPLINGQGRFPCRVQYYNMSGVMENLVEPNCEVTKQLRPVFSIKPNKRYRVRVLNTGAMSSFTFSIDGHKLIPIEVDGVDIAHEAAVPVDFAEIDVAQRYSFLIDTNKWLHACRSRYLIRATMQAYLGPRVPLNINPFVEQTLLSNATAVLQYNFSAVSPKPVVTSESFDYLQSDPPVVVANPVYLDDTTLLPLDGKTAPPTFDKQFNLTVTQYLFEGSIRTVFNEAPFQLPKDEPLIATMFKGQRVPNTANPMIVSHMDAVEIIVNNHETPVHPVHLHGHDFWVLGKGKSNAGNYNPSRDVLNLKTVKRDTVQVAGLSWVVIRFVADNPGLWAFHCHNDWHFLSGMAGVVVEGQEFIIANNASIPSEFKRVCSLQGIHI